MHIKDCRLKTIFLTWIIFTLSTINSSLFRKTIFSLFVESIISSLKKSCPHSTCFIELSVFIRLKSTILLIKTVKWFRKRIRTLRWSRMWWKAYVIFHQKYTTRERVKRINKRENTHYFPLINSFKKLNNKTWAPPFTQSSHMASTYSWQGQ